VTLASMPTDPSPPRTILVVDDELPVRRALAAVLENAGYSVLTAGGGHAALELMQKREVDLVVSDHHMPDMSGIDLLKLVRVRHPSVVRIILTADPQPEVPVRSINESEVYRFIRKPWSDSDLRAIMHFAFEAIRIEREKRRLLSLVRDERAAPLLEGSAEDPVGLERLLVAEDELARD
jgi:response regulator RpfG family c-di-GMP phosphodiesterase